MSRTCDGGGEAEVLSGGRSGLSLRGARGGGCPRPCWVVGAPFGRLFLSTGRQFLLRAAEARFSHARNRSAARLARGVHWVVRGLWARAPCLRGRLRCCAGVDRSDMAAVAEKRVLGIPLGWPRALGFSSRSGPTSPPRPAEALRLPLGLG